MTAGASGRGALRTTTARSTACQGSSSAPEYGDAPEDGGTSEGSGTPEGSGTSADSGTPENSGTSEDSGTWIPPAREGTAPEESFRHRKRRPAKRYATA
ncbi:hypothetical protein Sdagh_42280 [Streptomyces daghestanicus]|uniref:Uncharacterized protein n=1 Tax=Streptomyces daghestanicus TaxID=66885 RepID=A0ABQ3Q5D7_9ACTN|nr:hypothetical protein Sdagh_42280 [Streptomyces daghestanicus]